MSEYGRYLIDIGHYDITPEQEEELAAREECARLGIDPDELCADGGVEAWMVVAQQRKTRGPDRTCPVCGGDCAAANPPVYNCPRSTP